MKKNMIHRAPMTRKEMTEEDIKYRQGRRKEQVEGHAIAAMVGLIGLLGCLIFLMLFV
jgi:hypothetical protein|tara:strand:- start:284 stop:457 length:174 start_codon:yes stop_codon:yes gene_type:complete